MNKKGISPVLAWVLLLGFSITLAAITTVYVKNTAETQIEQTTVFVEAGMECDEVFWNVKYDSELFTLANTGGKTIKAYNYKVYLIDDTIETNEITWDIVPGTSENLTIDNIADANRVDFTPIIFIGAKRIGCNTKRLQLTKGAWAE